jgi:hypothetical protein
VEVLLLLLGALAVSWAPLGRMGDCSSCRG